MTTEFALNSIALSMERISKSFEHIANCYCKEHYTKMNNDRLREISHKSIKV